MTRRLQLHKSYAKYWPRVDGDHWPPLNPVDGIFNDIFGANAEHVEQHSRRS